MIPTRIKMQNFLSHIDTEIDLSDISMAVVTGPNGNGKSSLATDSILWALYGQGRGKSIDDMVTHGKDNCLVELTFLLDGQTYRVIRQRNTANGGKSLLQFDVLHDGKWKSLSGNGPRETQPKIEAVLNMNFDTLTNSSILIQGQADAFSKQDPAQRKAVLTQILGLDVYEEIAVKVREKGREIKSGIDALKMQLDNKEQELQDREQIDLDIVNAEREKEMWQAVIDENDRLLKDYLTQKEQMVKLQSEIRSIDSRRQEMTQDIHEQEYALTQISAKIQQLEQQLGQSDAIREYANKYKILRSNLDTMTELRNQNAELTNKILAAQNNSGALQTKRERAFREANNNYDIALKDLQNISSNIRVKLESAQSMSGELDNVPCKSTPMQNECKLLKSAVNARDQVETLQSQLKTNDALIWDLPNGKERQAILDAQKEMESENPFETEVHDLQKERIALNFDANSYAELNSTVEQLAKYPDMASKLDLVKVELDSLKEKAFDRQLQINDLNDKKNALDSDFQKTNLELNVFCDLPSLLESTETALSDARRRLTDENGILARLGEKMRHIGEIENQIIGLQKDLEGSNENLSLYADMATMFGKNGIQAMLIEKAIPAIESEANMLLGRLTDGLSISLETQRATKTGVAETLDIVIHDNEGARRYEMFSGGERFRIDVSLRIALSRLLANRAGAQMRFICFDEGFGTQDPEGLSRLMECLQIIASDYDLILVISHVPEMADAFPCRIEVTKDASGSHVEIFS